MLPVAVRDTNTCINLPVKLKHTQSLLASNTFTLDQVTYCSVCLCIVLGEKILSIVKQVTTVKMVDISVYLRMANESNYGEP